MTKRKSGIIDPTKNLIGVQQKSVEERIKEEEDRAESKRKELRRKDYEKQLEEFIKDDSYISEYADRIQDVKKDHLIVRLFKFVPDEKSAPKSGLLALDHATGKYVPKEEVMDSILTNYAKIIVSGSDKFKSGQTITLPYEEIRGFYKNPEWEQYLESLRTKGATPIMPKDTRELIPAYEVRMKQKIFVRPWLLEEEAEDRLTLLVSEYEVETVVNK
jgi:hypothetical protein